MKAIILAAGSSTRTFPLTLTRPKPLLPFLGRTLLDYTLDLLRDMNKIDEVVLVVHYKKEMIQDYFGDNHKGMKITYVDQTEPKGTGHAVLVTESILDLDFDTSVLIMNGDDIYSREDVASILESNPRIAVKEVDHPERFGVFETREKNGKTVARSLEEKPSSPRSNLANIGLYHFSSDFYRYLAKIKPSSRGELEITDAIKMYMDWNDVELMPIKGHWLPIGYPWDLLNATEKIMSMKTTNPNPIIDGSVKLKRNATITGYSVIGKNVTIHHDAIVVNSLVFDGATIGPEAVVKDSIIGADSKVEAEFRTINEANFGADPDGKIFSSVGGKNIRVNRKRFGCVLGDNVTIAKQVVTSPGIKVWPGKKIFNTRTVTEDQVE